MPIEGVNLLSHTRWLIDPIPLESDKTLTNGPAPACALLGKTAGSRKGLLLRPWPGLSLHPITPTLGFDQWGHSSHSDTHAHSETGPEPVITWLKGLEDIAFAPFTQPQKRKKKTSIKEGTFIKLSKQTSCPLWLCGRYFAQFPAAECKLVWLQIGKRLRNIRYIFTLPSLSSSPTERREEKSPLYLVIVVFHPASATGHPLAQPCINHKAADKSTHRLAW